MHACAARAHGVEHQPRELVRRRVRQAHGDFDLCQQPLPRRAAVQGHVRPGHPDLRAQVVRVALHPVEVREEVRHGARRVLRREDGAGAAVALRGGGGKLYELVLKRQGASRAARSAVDDVLQRAAKGGAGRPRAPQHLVRGLPLLDLARLAPRLLEPGLQALEACSPLRDALVAEDCKLLLQRPRRGGPAEHGRRQGVVAAPDACRRRPQ
mmetsp:Transcript_86476/g.253080  ORF Transcript_86476/g.253080 Transcript_86476/m.253080 type:complete len:211 (+) Transcript_86476:994-1626(+)